MNKNRLKVVIISAALFTAAILVGGSLPQVPSGSWIPVAPMNSARSGASTVLLQDGRILVTGGNDANGPTNTAEFFGANASFSLATPMNVPRSGHISVILQDGRVLVAGGTTSGGAVTNTAEIYDPTASTWTNVTGGMTEARSGHTAALLQDGRVLIAGGQNGSLISSTIEIFDPNLGTFAAAGMMSSPRTQHAMTVLQDGRVLIVGGNNGTAPVGSTNIFDPVAGTVSAGPNLTMARYGHSATTLLNGQVVVIGGNNGNANAAQMDVTPAELVDFTAATPAFATLASNLATPREGHLAFLLPNNNNVLIVGGTSGGATIASAELFSPQESPQGVWTYVFGPTGSMTTARSSATGAPNQVSSPSSVMQRNGVLLIAGGKDANGNALNSAEAYGFPTVQTDQSDYPPGTTVTITGSGWQPGETVAIQLVESPLIDMHGPYTVAADANGNISDNSFVTDIHDVDVRFYLTAAGQTSGFQAQNTFTDASSITFVSLTVGTQSGTPVYGTAGSATYAVTVTRSSNGTASATLSITGLPAGASGLFSPNPVNFSQNNTTPDVAPTLTINTTVPTPAGSTSFTVKATDDKSPHPTVSGNGTLQVNKKSVTASVTASNKTYDGTTSATITSCTIPGKVGTDDVACSVAPANANFSDKNVGTSKTVTATGITLTGTTAGNYVLSSTTATTMANITTATATVVVTPYTLTYDGHAHTAAVTSITGVNGETGATVGTVDVSNTTHTNAGTYASDSWSFTGTANYNNIAATTITDTVNKATATVVVTPYTVTYDGHAHTAAVTSISGVNGETGATVGTVDVSNTAHTNAGTYASDSWSFTGTANYNNIAATTITDTINKATATVVVTPYTVTYDGQAHTATVTSISGVNGETGATVGTVDVSNTTHTNAGTYASDSWSFTGTANYNNIAATTITDTINKATATVVVTPYSLTYDGQAHTATVTSITGVNGETGATVGTVTLNTTHTAAGTYASDSWSFTGTANYNNIAATTITDTINKATATVVVTPYTLTYDGQAHTAAVTSITGVNGETGATVGTVTLNTTHTAAGTYASDSWSFTGTANYNNIAATTITDTIDKATATVVVTPYSLTYDGQAHTATVTSITGVNGETGATVGTVTLNTTHTAAGTYASDSWSFTGTANYNNIAATTITDTINKATATVVVTPYSLTYDGQAHTATVTSITGVNGETGATVGTVDVSNTTHTAAGTYSSDSWSFTGTANYNNIAATTITDTINKATATVVVTPYSLTYDGQAHTATVTSITGVNGETGATVGTVDVSNTTHTAAGTYSSDSWSFTGSANYNNIAATTITDTINKATATVVVTPYTVTYDGQAHTATVTSITGVNGETGATVGTVDVSNTTHTAAGTYSSDSWTFTGSANYNNIAATTITDTINKATATVVVTPYTVTYDGQAHTATVTSITGVNGETGATVGTVDVSNTTHTNAGTYASDSWSFTGSANYNNIAATTITDTINKATATVVVTPYTVTYDGQAHTATVTSITGVNGETGAAVGTVDVSNTTHTAAGTYASDSWSFTGSANYNNIAATTITDTINKATATVVVTPYTVTYDGQAHTATVTSITGVNGETGATVGTVDVSNTTHTAAGTYASDSWSFTGTANYNNIASTTIQDVINKAPLQITAASGAMTYGGTVPTINTGNATYASFVNGESVSVLGAGFSCSTAVTSSSPVSGSPYPTTCSGGVDANYTITYSNGTITVNPASTSTTVITVQSPTVYGNLVTFTAGVTDNSPGSTGIPTGTVTFVDAGSPIGTGTLIGGVATFSTFALPPGTNVITTSYLGDGNFTGSTGTLVGGQTVIAVPVVSISPDAITFAPQDVNTTSAPMPVVLTNIGTAPLQLSSIQISGNDSGEFLISSKTCPTSLNATLAPGASCTVNVMFSPDDTGDRMSSLVFTDNDGGSVNMVTQVIGLTGSSFSVVQANFSKQSIAAGNTIWFNSVFSVKGPNGDDGKELDMSHAKVQVFVTDATITFTSGSQTYKVPVPDGLVIFDPTATLATTTFDGVQWITTVPAVQPNSHVHQFDVDGEIFASGVPFVVPAGGLPGGIKNVTWSAQYSSDTPGIRLHWEWGAAVYTSFASDPANYNNIGVKPTDDQKAPCNFQNSTKDPAGTPENSKQFWVLGATGDGKGDYTGDWTHDTGVVPTIDPVTVDTDPVVFTPLAAGATSSPTTITVTNNNQSFSAYVSSVAVTDSAEFNVTPGSGPCTVGSFVLPPSTSCTFSITFTPENMGTSTGTITFKFTAPPGMDQDDAPAAMKVDMIGTGMGGTNPYAALSLVTMKFPRQKIGTTSASQNVMLVNAGGAPLVITGIASTNSGEFAITSNPCGSTLAPAASCLIAVTFTPAGIGPRSGALTFSYGNNAVSSQTVNLTGSGSAW